MRESIMRAKARRVDSRERARRWLLTGVVLLVAGCATPAPPAPSSAQQQVDAAEALAVERHWLQSWFRSTPVRIAQRASGAIDIEVPREFCFETGRSVVEPALEAVLDKLAQSLGRVPAAQVSLIAAPGDGPVTTSAPGAATTIATGLALQRARAVREHLRDAGIDASRLGPPSAAAAPSVHLYITATAAKLRKP